MSWIDKIQNELIIITGDNKQYRPSWINATRQIEYNIAEFNFPGIPGTLVRRGEPMGRKYAIEIYFQGEDNIETSFAFEKSSNVKKPWTVQHPLYDTIIVHPMSLLFDNTRMNTTKITGVLIETITEDNPKTTADPVDTIRLKNEVVSTAFENALTAIPTPGDINTLSANNEKNYNLSVKIIKLPEEAEAYYNLFNAASSAINTATASPLLAMRATIAAINYPAHFTSDVKSRINSLLTNFNNLRLTLANVLGLSSKQLYQNSSGAHVSAMCLAASTPLIGDYKNGPDALSVVDTLLSAYNGYLEDLDSLQSDNGGEPNGFIPDATSIIELSNLVNITTSNLFNIALAARVERFIFLNEDSNVVVLTHRFYGLDPDDANLNEFIANNNFGMDDMIGLYKGRKIVYYI